MAAPLIVGYDGRAPAKDALALTRLLAAALDAPVVVVTVVFPDVLEVDGAAYAKEYSDRSRLLRDEALAVLLEAEVVGALASSPARELDRVARERNAQAVILGSTHRGALGRVIPGSVAERLLAGSPCAIAIAPGGFAEREAGLDRIAVAFDGSRESRTALTEAAEIAAKSGAALTLIEVFDPREPAEATVAALGYTGPVAPPTPSAERLERIRERLNGAIATLPEGIEASAEVIEGEPGTTLIESSKRFDLLVIGSRGYGPFGRVLMGSVSSLVIREAECPVIAMPRPQADQ